MTIEEFRNLKENDVIVLNNEPIEKHKDIEVIGFGAMLSCIEDLRNKTINGTKFQVDNCAEVEKNSFMVKFYTDGIVSENTFNRPFACIADNLSLFFDKLQNFEP